MMLDADDVNEPISATFPKSVQPGIPKLAAPRPGWTPRRFGDLLDVVQRPVRMLDSEEYNLVTVKRSRGGIEKRATLLGSDISVKSQFRIEGGDFLISRRQIVHGACAIVPAEFSGSIVSNEYAVLRCKPDLDLGFLKYLSHSIYFQQTCFHSSIGVHVEKMIFKLEIWLDWEVNVPDLDEQKRIGDGFSAVDAKIEALRRKKSGLEAFKSGLMQRLFSQTLRFTRDDGTDFPDWEKMSFGNLATIRKGKQVNRDTLSDVGDYPVINGGTSPSGFHTEYNTPRNTITISEGGNSCGHVAWQDMHFWCGGHCYAIKAKNDVILDVFLYQVLKFNEADIMRLRVGSGLPNIQKGDLAQFELPVPHSGEQLKISDALGALDAKIAAVADQITHMETFKKGLLQQMFV